MAYKTKKQTDHNMIMENEILLKDHWQIKLPYFKKKEKKDQKEKEREHDKI